MQPTSKFQQASSRLLRYRRPIRRFVRGKFGQRSLFISAIVLLAYAGGGVLDFYHATHHPVMQAPTQVVTTSADRPSETKPNPQAEYKVAPDKPRLISLPSIGIEGFVQQVGVDQHRAIAVPSNIHMAGWFNQSQLPGTPGLSIIDGHLDGRTGGGIFEHLAKLKAGDRFSIGFGDGAIKTFVVRTVRSLPTAETAAVLFSQDPKISNQLNLITCAGTYNEAKKQYDERVVVIGELVHTNP